MEQRKHRNAERRKRRTYNTKRFLRGRNCDINPVKNVTRVTVFLSEKRPVRMLLCVPLTSDRISCCACAFNW